MGQYYTAYVIDDLKKPEFMGNYCPSDADEGLKLLANGRMGSKTVQSVLKVILNAPKHVAWIGEYYDDKDDPVLKDVAKEFIRIVSNAETGAVTTAIDTLGLDNIESYTGYFLLNHTKKQFVDYRHYIYENARAYTQRYHGSTSKAEMVILALDPLPLLTCCCNGLGGGDYYGRDAELCGAWAGDLIEFQYVGMHYRVYDSLEGFEEVCPNFVLDY